MRVFSFGGGVQSTAALVLAAQGELAIDAFLFANVGEDSENPRTLDYVRDVSGPYAARHGLALHELRQMRRDGEEETIYGRITGPRKRGNVIPAYAAGGPMQRQCTHDFKITVVRRWIREHGATPKHPAALLLGISFDEWHRMRTGGDPRYITREYPLIDRRISRQDCLNIIARAGLPEPPKSSCYFCPFHNLRNWREIRDTQPEQFAKAIELEKIMTARQGRPIYLTSKKVPLAKAVGEAIQPGLFDDGVCESGYCMV